MQGTGADFRGQGGNAGNGIVYADGFAGPNGAVGPKTIANSTVSFDPPSLATGAVAVSSGMAVTGAAIGDHIELYPPYDTQGVAAQGQVSAANTIVISLHNRSAATVDLATGSWGVVVKRRV